jgi:hypothetical protein
MQNHKEHDDEYKTLKKSFKKKMKKLKKNHK